MKLSILVPVYNEEKTIAQVLSALGSLDISPWEKEIIVINDCSTDKTTPILKHFSSSLVKIVTHRHNQGKTAAIKTGLNRASGDYVIIQDADLEYNPEDILRLLAEAKKFPGQVVYGSRFKINQDKDTIFGHKAGNFGVTLLTNLLFGAKLTDMETCYKLIPRSAFKRITIETNRFGFEPEVTAKLLLGHYQIREVPISYVKRGFSEGKKLHWWRDGWATVKILLTYRLKKL